jgi:hypothetical protein
MEPFDAKEKDFSFNVFQTTKDVITEISETAIDEKDCNTVWRFVLEFNELSRFIEGKLK